MPSGKNDVKCPTQWTVDKHFFECPLWGYVNTRHVHALWRWPEHFVFSTSLGSTFPRSISCTFFHWRFLWQWRTLEQCAISSMSPRGNFWKLSSSFGLTTYTQRIFFESIYDLSQKQWILKGFHCLFVALLGALRWPTRYFPYISRRGSLLLLNFTFCFCIFKLKQVPLVIEVIF
jgi:hypothetical protein